MTIDRRAFVASLAAGAAACATRALGTAVSLSTAPDAAAGVSLVQRLGFPADARLLIINLDDLGLLHTVNAAAFGILDAGPVVSGSLMAPCPWFPEAAEYARTHPGLDLGLHLTFTSERPSYRWAPVLGAAAVPTLVDEHGFFPISWDESRNVNLTEVDAEMRAQLARARDLGLNPTHLDSHQHCLQWRGPSVFDLLLRLAAEHKLPVRAGRNWLGEHPYLADIEPAGGVLLDRIISVPPGTPAEQWTAWYRDTIRTLRPGVTELFLHPAYDDGEMRSFAPSRLSWGSAWRQRDLDAITSPAVREVLTSTGVKLIRWSDVGRLIRGAAARG
jgi:predicted glycoside hydrolase/deacetylase ChbG (UPF0249 family)